MRWPVALFIFFLITAILLVDGGLTTQRPGSKHIISSEEIAKSRIRTIAQQEILKKSRLQHNQSPTSPISPQSGGSGASSPQFPRTPLPKNPTILQQPPPPRNPIARPAAVDTTSARKSSCASVCEKVFQQPALPVCVFDTVTREYITLRNSAHVTCYKCLHPLHQVEVVRGNNCDRELNRRRRWIGSP